jgi:hypothetical protein
VRFDFCFHVRRGKDELITQFGGEQLTSGCIRIAITDKTDRVSRVADHAGCECVARRTLDHHA